MLSPLSPREKQVVELSSDGLTNEAIAMNLGVSLGTVNTYWLRIRMKVGGFGKTDTVARVIQARAESALQESDAEKKNLAGLMQYNDHGHMELHAVLELLHLAMDHRKATVWATDCELVTQLVASGDFPEIQFGVGWEAGKTVYDIFKTTDPNDPAIAAHLNALTGATTELRLNGEFPNLLLRVAPFSDELGECLGTIGILTTIA